MQALANPVSELDVPDAVVNEQSVLSLPTPFSHDSRDELALLKAHFPQVWRILAVDVGQVEESEEAYCLNMRNDARIAKADRYDEQLAAHVL